MSLEYIERKARSLAAEHPNQGLALAYTLGYQQAQADALRNELTLLVAESIVLRRATE